MRKLALALAFTAIGLFAQEHGGAPAHPPAPGTAPTTPAPAHGEQATGSHAEKAGEHGTAAVQQGEAHGEQQMPNEIWWKWANFALLAVLLGYVIGKNAGPFFRARSESIQKGISEAAAARAEAEARAAAIEQKIANLSAEVADLRAKSREEIAAEGARVSAETEQQIVKIQAQSQHEIAAAVKSASQDLKAQAAELALNLAEQQIRSRMNPGVQDALVQSFLRDIDGKAVRN